MYIQGRRKNVGRYYYLPQLSLLQWILSVRKVAKQLHAVGKFTNYSDTIWKGQNTEKTAGGGAGGGKLPRKLVQHITGSQHEITKNWTTHTVSKCKKLTLLLKQIENWYLIQPKSE